MTSPSSDSGSPPGKPTVVPAPQWKYVPDEDPKDKHHWEKNEAGFIEVNGVQIGKCPNNMTLQQAQQLLESGLPWFPKGWKKAFPKRIYNIRNKVVYRATPTIPGQSYHGFPERPDGVPPEMRKPLLALAEQQGCHEEVKAWLKG
jgi:hypothetical protein